MELIVEDLKLLKLGQEVIYDDLLSELNELKEYYFLATCHHPYAY